MELKPLKLILMMGALSLTGSWCVHAHAGLIFPSAELAASEWASLDSAKASGSAPAREKQAPRPWDLLERNGPLSAVLGVPGSSGGMSSQPVQSSPASSPAALAAVAQELLCSTVVSRLIVERNLSLPPPLANRLFRPPRS